MEALLRVEDLTKIYTARSGEKIIANKGLNLEIAQGEILVILGSNGAGKSTLIRQISTELLPTSGTITVAGHDVIREPERVRRVIGVMPQGGNPLLHLGACENLYYFARLKGFTKQEANEECEKMMQRLDLTEYRHRVSLNLSGGIRRRILFGIALLSNPKLLLLDEPTAGQDPLARRNIHTMIKDMIHEGGRSVLLTTHDLFDAHALADRLAILHQGTIRFVGTEDELLTSTNTTNLFDAFFAIIEGVFNNGQASIARHVDHLLDACEVDIVSTNVGSGHDCNHATNILFPV